MPSRVLGSDPQAPQTPESPEISQTPQPPAGRRRPLLAAAFYGRSARRPLVLAFFGALIQHAGAVTAAAAAGWLVGATAEGRRPGQLTAAIVILAVAVAAATLGTWLNGLYGHAFAFRHQTTLRLGVFDGLERSAPRVLLGKRSGELAAITMGDVEVLEGFFAHLGITAAVAAVVAVGAVTALGLLYPVFAVVAAVGVIGIAVVPTLLARRGRRLGDALRDDLGALNAEVVDGIQGLRELVVFRQTRAWTERVRRRTADYQSRQLAHGRATGLQAACTDLLMSATSIALLLLAVSAAVCGSITLPTATMALPLIVAALAPVAEAAGMASGLAPLRAAARRVLDVIDQPAYVPDTGAFNATVPGTVVRFEDVTFGYQPDRPVLHGVSFEAAPGELVAVVGPTGAGKSTCANLLLRFWDPDSGRVTIGGVDLRDLPLAELRRLVAVVPQDVYLFADTVAGNLRVADPDATDGDLEAAARSANAHTFVAALEDGYDTELVERGSRLSGGERQRLAIARALLRASPILLMDEAAANLDAENERDIQNAVQHLRQGRTTIVIAHRLSTIRAADRVVFLRDGRVAATGGHEQLLVENPAYAALVATQLSAADAAR